MIEAGRASGQLLPARLPKASKKQTVLMDVVPEEVMGRAPEEGSCETLEHGRHEHLLTLDWGKYIAVNEFKSYLSRASSNNETQEWFALVSANTFRTTI